MGAKIAKVSLDYEAGAIQDGASHLLGIQANHDRFRTGADHGINLVVATRLTSGCPFTLLMELKQKLLYLKNPTIVRILAVEPLCIMDGGKGSGLAGPWTRPARVASRRRAHSARRAAKGGPAVQDRPGMKPRGREGRDKGTCFST